MLRPGTTPGVAAGCLIVPGGGLLMAAAAASRAVLHAWERSCTSLAVALASLSTPSHADATASSAASHQASTPASSSTSLHSGAAGGASWGGAKAEAEARERSAVCLLFKAAALTDVQTWRRTSRTCASSTFLASGVAGLLRFLGTGARRSDSEARRLSASRMRNSESMRRLSDSSLSRRASWRARECACPSSATSTECFSLSLVSDSRSSLSRAFPAAR
mmetsp:Transcript_47103/g.114476  ORF Transcript_47103/g.114476 Transcript_47103/m.114476 type:complete len:220 (-) Transcript_47103:1656-2315(-)